MAKLSIFLSGSYQVSLSEKHANNFESNKVRALLAYLALEVEPVAETRASSEDYP